MKYRNLLRAFCALMVTCLNMSECGAAARPPEKAESAVGTERFSLVSDGRAVASVVIGQQATPAVKEAVERFVATIEESTGARLPVVEESESLPTGNLLFVGQTKAADQAGVKEAELPDEACRILVQGSRGYVVGKDLVASLLPDRKAPNSVATRWGLNRILEDHLGVRWLWPGKLGTYVPNAPEIVIPDMDMTLRPELILRRYRPMLGTQSTWSGAPVEDLKMVAPEVASRMMTETVEWLENHQAGRRTNLQFGHAFGHWWEKYAKDHPDYFAVPPPGVQQPLPNAERVKLRLANPAVIEQIAEEYRQAGSPEYYNVCPNDGYGFDTSEESRAWDVPANQPIEDIWMAQANLTARYVTFWNKLSARLREINPQVKLVSYAYSCYRYAPPKEVVLDAPMVLGIVDSYHNFATWKEWADTGSQMILRPNWWHMGGDAPCIPLRQVADFLAFAQKNGLIAVDMDSILGYWANQGLNYYLVARLMERPELTRDDVVAEYASAFGAGAPKIREYIQYWEDVTESIDYPVPAGGQDKTDEKKLYQKFVKSKGVSPNPIGGSYWLMPHVYTDEVIDKGEAFLREARALIPALDRTGARDRVDFLLSGLEDLRAVRDVMQAAIEAKAQPGDASTAELRRKADQLFEVRKRITPSHAVWGDLLFDYETSIGLPTLKAQSRDVDLRGL